MDLPQNPNCNYPPFDSNYFMDLLAPFDPFRLSDDLMFGDSSEQSAIATNTGSQEKAKEGIRVAFRTKSELEIMDDGYKWRKYGKKSVKNSPNPRNYYKCSSEGCKVKKRVERDKEDSRYVITTYDGVHSHESPCLFYHNQMPLKS